MILTLMAVITIIVVFVAILSTKVGTSEMKDSIIGSWVYDYSYNYVETQDEPAEFSDSYDSGFDPFYIVFRDENCTIYCDGDEATCSWDVDEEGIIETGFYIDNPTSYPAIDSILGGLEYHTDNKIYAYTLKDEKEKIIEVHVFSKE